MSVLSELWYILSTDWILVVGAILFFAFVGLAKGAASRATARGGFAAFGIILVLLAAFLYSIGSSLWAFMVLAGIGALLLSFLGGKKTR